jgi:glycosyltransferase involved in cell wall biosynthesis
VVVIADSLKKETIQILQQMKLYVVEVNFENSTKGKSLNAALAVVGNKDYDYAVVLDIDNIIEPLSLEKINSALAKGQFVLQAFSILKASGKLPCKLLMLDINRGYLQNLAQEIGDPSIVDEITFTGFVPNQELPAIYSRATLFLYPLLRESFGIPLVEAMRCEVPVITSNTSSMPDIVDNAALICNPFNPNSITNAIFDLWNNPTLQSTLRNKGKLRGDFFSWKQNAPDTLAIYQSIIQ